MDWQISYYPLVEGVTSETKLYTRVIHNIKMKRNTLTE